MKCTRSKASRGLVTRRIVYRDRKHPHDRPRELKVDLPRGEVLDTDYAAAMVAAGTTTPLTDVLIIAIEQ